MKYFEGKLGDGVKVVRLVRLVCFEPCLMTDMEKHRETSDSVSLANCECKSGNGFWHQRGQSCILHQRSSSYKNWRDFLRCLRFLSLRISMMLMYIRR